MTDDKAFQSRALDRVAVAAKILNDARESVEGYTADLHTMIRRAVDAGVPGAEVARVAGVSKGRVSQLAPVAKGVETQVHAQKEGVEPVRVNDPDTVPALPDTSTPALSGYESTRKRQPYGRATMFYDVANGTSVAAVGTATLRDAGAEHLPVGSVAHILHMHAVVCQMTGDAIGGRVFLTGPAPTDESAGATQAERVRAWALADPPAGWRVSDRGHYLHDADLPILRFTDDANRHVVIARAAGWWGESDADAITCAAAWRGLGDALDAVPAFRGAGLADTPATTGRALWLRTIPEGKGYPVLSDELRGLIHATSGQGRIELRPARLWAGLPADRQYAVGEDFTYLDGRFMYAALTWGMPVGEPHRWTGAAFAAADARTQTSALKGRGRWRITCQVPATWDHVGMLMAPAAGGGWCYPAEPGQVFTTWADGSEVWAAMENGWRPTIHEGITWAEGKPLNTWRDGLVSVWERANAAAGQGSEPAALAARAVRSILLYALGAFASQTHNVTGSCSIDTPELVPDNAIGGARRVGESLVWETPGTLSAWSAETAHPEWSATVWARARTRLLTGRGVGQERVGALHLPVDRVIAFATDALYVAGGSPGWTDDGTPGRFRVKGIKPGVFGWPADRNALYLLRDQAEAGAW